MICQSLVGSRGLRLGNSGLARRAIRFRPFRARETGVGRSVFGSRGSRHVDSGLAPELYDFALIGLPEFAVAIGLDEADGCAESILELVPNLHAHVPCIWPLEVIKALLVGERRQPRLGGFHPPHREHIFITINERAPRGFDAT